MKNNKFLVLTLAFVSVIVLTLFLAYRMLASNYEQSAADSIDQKGHYHTLLVGELLQNRLHKFRDELREDALRLVDEHRGPLSVDPAHWLWIRVQDRDWRAPNYLDPLPQAMTGVDTWGLRGAKKFFHLSERVPFMRDGVQDFVLVEGGLRNDALADLQQDAHYGIWLIDLKAYKEAGLSAAKVLDLPSSDQALGNSNSKMTSDFLAQLFNSETVVHLPSDKNLSFFFRNVGDNWGILSYWTQPSESINLWGTWLSLGLALIGFAFLLSLLIMRFFAAKEESSDDVVTDKEKKIENAGGTAPPTTVKSFQFQSTMLQPKPAWEPFMLGFAEKLKSPFAKLLDHLNLAFEDEKASTDPIATRVLKHLEVSKEEALRCRRSIDRIVRFSIAKDPLLESFDLEVFWKEIESDFKTENSKVETFFHPELWRIKADRKLLAMLLSSYIHALRCWPGSSEEHIKLSTKFYASEVPQAEGEWEIVKSPHFHAPFVRLQLRAGTLEPLKHQNIEERFSMSNTNLSTLDIELPLSIEAVKRLTARLYVKSNMIDGHTIILDLPASEERRAEDIVNSGQDKGFVDESLPPEENSKANQENQTPTDGAESAGAAKVVRLSEIERAKNSAGQISDERSRVRSRFRIRRPGEKD